MYNKIIRLSKKKFYDAQFNENKNNIKKHKKTWSLLREVTKKTKDKSSVIEEINVNGRTIHDSGQIAESFNEFFSSIGAKIAEEISPSKKLPEDHLIGDFPDELHLYLSSPEEIIELTKKLKDKHSCDSYRLSSHFIKKIIHSIAVPFSHIVNNSFENGRVPINYRPISLLPIFSKILEKLVANRLAEFLKRFQVLFEHQYGFQKAHSTIHPIVHFLNHIAEANN